MTLTLEAVRELRDGCAGVTKGPWTWEGTIYEHMGAEVRGARGIAQIWQSPCVVADAAHIARCDPQTIQALTEGYLAMAAAVESLNVTDEELLRIRNRAEHETSSMIWSTMLQKIVDNVRDIRAALPPGVKL